VDLWATPALTRFSARNNTLTGSLCDLVPAVNLRHLNIDHNQVGDNVNACLGECLTRLPNLEYASYRGNLFNQTRDCNLRLPEPTQQHWLQGYMVLPDDVFAYCGDCSMDTIARNCATSNCATPEKLDEVCL
jgi:hypothetical protein